jgi:hypothetical protein
MIGALSPGVPYGQTDVTNLTVAFRNFANAPKMVGITQNHMCEKSVTVKLGVFQEKMYLNLKSQVFSVVTPCRAESSFQRFGGLQCLHLQGEAVREYLNLHEDAVRTPNPTSALDNINMVRTGPT